MPDRSDHSPVAVVVGSGPAGLTTAIALAEGGISTALVGRRPTRPDHRTTALLTGSVTALETLGVWQSCAAHAAPLKVMRIVDDTERLWRAPEVKFAAHEIDLDAFGYNIENRHLVTALEQRARSLPKLRLVEDEVVKSRLAATTPQPFRSRAATHCARCLLWAPTAANPCPVKRPALQSMSAATRKLLSPFACGIPVHTTTHQRNFIPHPVRLHLYLCRKTDRVSFGFSILPRPTSLRRAVTPTSLLKSSVLRIPSLARSNSNPGAVCFPSISPRRGASPDKRIALVGEAAHVVPPIGAQGLNLGLRDAATIGELAVAAQRDGQDIGNPDVLARYDRMRRTDIGSRTLVIDLFNRTLLSDFLPVQGIRGVGLYLIDRIGPLRRAVMREGVAPTAAQPRLMRGEAL